MPTRIEWCDETINPFGYGCYGPGGTKECPKICEYCYALKMARRGLRKCSLCKKFTPHIHFDQLQRLEQWTKSRNIFVQSMGDVFGDWIIDEWITALFKKCLLHLEHRYLFLTKNPKRYDLLDKMNVLPHNDNFWYGVSITDQKSYDDYTRINRGNTVVNRFLSIEPLHSIINLTGLGYRRIKWVIIGAESGNRKVKIIPKKEWIQWIIDVCKYRNFPIPVFMKDSLIPIVGEENMIREFPLELKK